MQACTSCGAKLIPGSVFCDACGAATSSVKVARKLRQGSFSKIKDAKEGLLSTGERIKGRYVYLIEEAVARSGFGATFRAQRTKDEMQVLIKQMIDQASYDQFKGALLNSFKREAKFLQKTKHPAFPRGFEYFERNKSFYLVMEFINGKELAKAIEEHRSKQGKIEDGLIVHIGIEIADALEVIHAQGYIYRDLKPQNVMLDGISSRVKLIDFGTLYHQGDSDPLLFESEGYTPPDLLEKSKRFQPSGDIYSLGALLYEMAMGETPAFGDTKRLDSSKIDLRLKEIIRKCLEKDPLKRYQRARQVRDELTKLTRKGFWPFTNKNSIEPMELSVLPKTLFPSHCTFCDFCGYSDANSQAGYCPKCRVPLKVGRITLRNEKNEKQREFFLYADQTIIGSSSPSHFEIHSLKDKAAVSAQHFRVFRRKNGLWVEALEKQKDNLVINRRKILGPVELIEGDTIKVGDVVLTFDLKNAC